MFKPVPKTNPGINPDLSKLAAAALSLLLLPNPDLLAQITATTQTPSQSLPAAVKPQKLSPDQRTLHLLSRFTFGPTPTDIATVQKIGIDRWFEQQLRPDTIPDSPLQARLAEFPALTLPVDKLIERFPSGAQIRQTANGKRDMPRDPTLAAIYNRHIDLYEEKEAKKAEDKKADGKPGSMIAATTIVPVHLGEMNSVSARDMNGQMAVQKPEAAKPEIPKPEPVQPNSPDNPDHPNRPSYSDLLVQSVLDQPPAQRVSRILAMPSRQYELLRSSMKGPQKAQMIADMTPAQRELVQDFDNPTRTVIEELQSQRLLRDIYSSRQLQEVMTTFWLNHFNVYLHKNEETPYYLVSYERDVIRPHALGNFEDLLLATAKSPAMLIYLDNSSSTGPDSDAAEKQKRRAAQGKPSKATPPGLNENYARELMELHTLGVNGGYTQTDVTEVAKVFTGWTVDKPGQGGDFKFDETRHEPGKKLVMGKKIKENGEKEGLQLLHILATSPATAHFISQELAIAFVSDNPPPTLVDRMAKTFRSQHGEIASVLKTMLHSPEFWAPDTWQAKVKTPLEYVVSSARASGAEITNTQPLINALNQMGMPLYACVPPTGYSAKADEWVSTGALVTRMNFALTLSNNKFGGIQSNWTSNSAQTNSAPATPDVSEQVLEARLIPTGVSDQTRTAVLEQTQAPAPNQTPTAQATPSGAAKPLSPAATQAALERQNAQLAGLLLGSPEFQRR